MFRHLEHYGTLPPISRTLPNTLLSTTEQKVKKGNMNLTLYGLWCIMDEVH